MFLYEHIELAKTYGAYNELPQYIKDNLNPKMPLRPYQEAAFQNFVTYFENPKLRKNPSQTLFHMATGSGKTLIMAGLIIYLYKQGYRNFIFFVNLTNIVQKTKENILNPLSSKYLFSDKIIIDGEYIPIKEVSNFQFFDKDAINILFTSTSKLHSDMGLIKENSISYDDFKDEPIVLISDESHHLNVSTKKINKKLEEETKSWEETVNRIFNSNNKNVLLEFTATCEIQNQLVRNSYENKIIYDYPLQKFRTDLYSKEILTLRSDLDAMDRALQAIMLSQYRLKVFQDNRLSIKPVILFKSDRKEKCKIFMTQFIETVRTLTGSTLERISTKINNEAMKKAYAYFSRKSITFNALAQELKNDFSEEHCISANDDEIEYKQIILNSLEDNDNPYRAIFEVKKLDEGWDVLNLFDIVRLYETRQSSGKNISPSTISEAPLIGRGARYYPFQLDKTQLRYQRKYDNDINNELRICEELYYHCYDESRYIDELYNALREIGIDLKKNVQCHYILKEKFKEDVLYKEGLVFINDREIIGRDDVDGLLTSVSQKIYTISIETGGSGVDLVMDISDDPKKNNTPNIHTYKTTFGKLAKINYAIVNKALMRHNLYKFNILKSYFPLLVSTSMFITGDNYLGNIRIDIKSRYEEPPTNILHEAAFIVLGKISNSISSIVETYQGTKNFRPLLIHEVFRNKTVNYYDPQNSGAGISQNDHSLDNGIKIDLSKEDWFAYDDNFGTSEEKAFVAYFKGYVDDLKAKYDTVYLVRNERHLHIFSFDGGERFEPDYLLFLKKKNTTGFTQMQIFIEPKGNHLLEADKWKEDFLLQLESMAEAVKIFLDDNQYRIRGFHFYNHDHRGKEFDDELQSLVNIE